MSISFASVRHCFLGIALLLLGTQAQAEPAPQVTAFLPVGMQREVRQVQLRFSDEIAALGDDTAPDPATVTCKGTEEKPVGHWQNGRTWVAEYAQPLSDGIRCTVTPNSVTTSAGKPVTLLQSWTFNTGGPRIKAVLGSKEGQANIFTNSLGSTIDPVAAFSISAAADPKTLGNLHCKINDVSMPVHVLTGTERNAAYSRIWQLYRPALKEAPLDDKSIIAQCGEGPLPHGVNLAWIWGKEITSMNGVPNLTDDMQMFHVPPMLLDSLPQAVAGNDKEFGRSALFTEDTVTAFSFLIPVDKVSLKNLYCDEHPARILSGDERLMTFSRLWKEHWGSYPEPAIGSNWVIAQCYHQPLKDHKFKWVWGAVANGKRGIPWIHDKDNLRPIVAKEISNPIFGNGRSTEDPFTIFVTARPVDVSTLRDLRCSVNGSELPVQILHNTEEENAYQRILQRHSHNSSAYLNAENKFIAQCGSDPWPNDAVIHWQWGKTIVTTDGIADLGDRTVDFAVRPSLWAEAVCSQLTPDGNCDERKSISYVFSNSLSVADVPKLSLHGSSGEIYHATAASSLETEVNKISFPGPFVKGETLALEWQADLRDVDGRALNIVTPAHVKLSRLPAYLGMVKDNGSYLWQQAGHPFMWPFAARNTEKSLKVRTWQFGKGVDSTPALLALLDPSMRKYHNGQAMQVEDLLDEFSVSRNFLSRVNGQLPKPVDKFVSTSGAEMEFAGIALNDYGTWLVEADSPAYRETLAKRLAGMLTEIEREDPRDAQNEFNYNRRILDKFDALTTVEKSSRMSIVQLTNLQISARLSPSGKSLIWLTDASSGRPISGASIEIWSCTRQLLRDSKSDAQGQSVLDSIQAPECNNFDESGHRYDSASPWFWIVARNGGDVAVLNSSDRNNSDRDSDSRYNYYSTNGGVIGHTILDRTLFHPGETVSMQHLLRVAGEDGWTIPPQGTGKLRITNPLGEVMADEELDWKADGSADSTWQFPESAKLGNYSFEVYDAQQRVVSQGGFALEEFRIPLFNADVNGDTFWRGTSQSLRLKAGLEFKTGGAASGQTIRLTGTYRAGWFDDPDKDKLGLNSYGFGNQELPNTDLPEFTPKNLKLDRQGHGEIVQPAPNSDAFLFLDLEMEFSDASGEIKTASTSNADGNILRIRSSIPISPQKDKVGLAVERAETPNVVSLSAIVLDDKNKPKAQEWVKIDFAEAEWHVRKPARQEANASANASALSIKSPRMLACTVQTDAQGKAQCDIPWQHATETDGWVFRARADGASTASIEVEKNRFIWSPPSVWKSIPAVLKRTRTDAPKPGDIEHLQIRSPFLPANMLLTVEREGVLTSRVQYLTKEVETVDLPMEARFAPNIHVVAQFVSGVKKVSNDIVPQPSRTERASLDIVLNPASNELSVDVQADNVTAHPGQPLAVKLTVTHATGNTPAVGASVTLIAVDEGLLELHPNYTWELLSAFWKMRFGDVFGLYSKNVKFDASGLGMHGEYLPQAEVNAFRELPFQLGALASHGKDTRHALLAQIQSELMYFRDPFHKENGGKGIYTVEIVGEIMRRADKETPSSVQVITANTLKSSGWQDQEKRHPRTNFSTLAHWQTDLVTDEHGEVSATIQMPDSLTNWDIVAIATEGADRFGTGKRKIKTSQQIQILSGLPQAVRSGDVVRQKITVRNVSNSTVHLNIDAQATEMRDQNIPFARTPATAEAAASAGLQLQRQIKLRSGESRVIDWPVNVPDELTQLDWNITAKDVDGDAEIGDAMVITQRIVPVAPVTVRESTTLQVDGAQSLTVAQPATAVSNADGITVRWQNSLVEGAVHGARAWMATYPFSCMEQRSSKAAVSGDPRQWAEVMATLRQHMDKEGLVAYFPMSHLHGSETLTAYLLDLADAYGLPLPEKEKKRMQDALRGRLLGTQINDWTPSDDQLVQRLALQAAVAPDLGAAMPVIPRDLNQLPTVALVDWARYLLKTPDSVERNGMLGAAASQLRSRYDIQGTRAVWRNDRDENLWWFMWTEDTAVARTALLAQQWSAVDPSWKYDAPLLIRSLIGRQQHGNWSTTTGNVWGVAAVTYFEKNIEHAPVTGVSNANFNGVTHSVNWPSPAPIQIPWSSQRERSKLELSHEGTGAPWATVQILAAAKSDRAINHGVTVHKTITPYSQRVKGQWSEGDVMQVTLEMTADRDLSWLVVRDPIPSGATILDGGVNNFNNDQWWWTPSFVERTNDSFLGYYQRIWFGKWTTQYLVRLNNSGRFNFPATRIEAMYSPEIFGETPNPGLIVGGESSE